MKRVRLEHGFTLIEVMVATLVFSVVLAGMVPVFIAHMKKNTDMEVRTGAMQAAQAVLDDLRLEDPATLPASGSDPVLTLEVNGRPYEVTTSYCQDPSLCITAGNRHISIEVTHRGRLFFTTETVYTRLR